MKSLYVFADGKFRFIIYGKASDVIASAWRKAKAGQRVRIV